MATNWKQRALDAEAQLANRPAELDQARADLDAARERGNELHAEVERITTVKTTVQTALWRAEDAIRDIPDNIEALVDVLEPRQHMGIHNTHPDGNRPYRDGSELHVKLQAKARAILAHLRARAGG